MNSTFDRPRQNKANCWIAACGFRIADWAQTCNGAPFAGRQAGGQLYKQSQFRRMGRARRNYRRSCRLGTMRQTSPIPGGAHGTGPEGRGRWPIVPNKANSKQVGRGRPTYEETIVQNKAK